VDRISMMVFVVAGVLAALGGLVLTGYVGALNAAQGSGMVFTVFAAAVSGGSRSTAGAAPGILALLYVIIKALNHFAKQHDLRASARPAGSPQRRTSCTSIPSCGLGSRAPPTAGALQPEQRVPNSGTRAPKSDERYADPQPASVRVPDFGKQPAVQSRHHRRPTAFMDDLLQRTTT
jgi:hypothetical protein